MLTETKFWDRCVHGDHRELQAFSPVQLFTAFAKTALIEDHDSVLEIQGDVPR